MKERNYSSPHSPIKLRSLFRKPLRVGGTPKELREGDRVKKVKKFNDRLRESRDNLIDKLSYLNEDSSAAKNEYSPQIYNNLLSHPETFAHVYEDNLTPVIRAELFDCGQVYLSFGDFHNGEFRELAPSIADLVPKGIGAIEALEIEAKAFGDLEKELTLMFEDRIIKQGEKRDDKI